MKRAIVLACVAVMACGGEPEAVPSVHARAQADAGADADAQAEAEAEAEADAGAHAEADAQTVTDAALTPLAIDDGFESPTLDARWTVLGAEGHQSPTATTAVLDSTRAHAGSRSVHVHDGFLQAASPGESFYLRAFVWFDADPGAGHWMSWVGVGPGDQQGTTEVRYGGHYDILQANFFGNDDEAISDPKGYCSPTCANGVAVPVRAWTCVEAYFGKDEIRFWMNDQAIDTLTISSWKNAGAPWSPAYDRARVGFHDFQGGVVDVWYDDVAIDGERIGCAR